jgi:HD superfamily phosphodiesterase
MERVRDEFDKIMNSRHPIETVRLLHETKLLEYIIPELEESWGFNQNSKYHSMNLTDHSLEVLRLVCRESISGKLRLAALLHDIAKYKCWTINTRSEFSYHGHEAKSAEIAEKILTRLRYPGETISYVSRIIKNHMIIKKFYDPVTDSYTGTDAQTRKIIRTLGDYLRDTMSLIDADNRSHAPSYNMPGQVNSFYEKLVKLKDGVNIVRVCPVSGDIIMKELNLKPGPVIKEVKEIFLEWLDEKPGLTTEELIAEYKKTYPEDGYFWIWKDMNRQDGSLLTLGKPTEYGSTYSAPRYEAPYELDYTRVVTREVQQWKASEHPDLYRRLLRYRKVWEIVDKVGESLDKLFKIKGFESINLVFDSDYDLSATVKWNDEKPTYII